MLFNISFYSKPTHIEYQYRLIEWYLLKNERQLYEHISNDRHKQKKSRMTTKSNPT